MVVLREQQGTRCDRKDDARTSLAGQQPSGSARLPLQIPAQVVSVLLDGKDIEVGQRAGGGCAEPIGRLRAAVLLKAVVKAEQAQGWRRKLWPAVLVSLTSRTRGLPTVWYQFSSNRPRLQAEPESTRSSNPSSAPGGPV